MRETYERLLSSVCLPRFFQLDRSAPQPEIADVRESAYQSVKNCPALKKLHPGQTVAVTAGSRDVHGMRLILEGALRALKEANSHPFIVPAMGSHGGATAEGQRAVLTGYGITEETVGMPVRATMDTVCYDQIGGLPLYCDRYAAEADGIVVFNKIKPHTDFHGRYESGLAKMMTIGLGKHRGATAFHGLGFARFPEFLPQARDRFMAHFPVLCGVGVLQNERDDIFHVEVIPPASLAQRETELLELARTRLPRFPLRDVDLLLLDEVGKNISGSGYDPNIFARRGDPVHDAHTATRYRRLYIRSLTKESGHMGTGVFHADFASLRLVSDVDWSATWTNCVTCQLSAGRGVPIYLGSDREALRACMQTLTPLPTEKMAILWAKNTLNLTEFLVSKPLYEQLRGVAGLQMEEEPYVPSYDEEGYLSGAFAP